MKKKSKKKRRLVIAPNQDSIKEFVNDFYDKYGVVMSKLANE